MLIEITRHVNSDLANIREWLIANKQMFIGFDSNLMKISQRNSFIHIDGQPVDRVSSSKALGVVIDERLCCYAHTDYICKKVSSAIGGLRQIRDFIPLNIAITVYSGWLQPWFDYCDVVWDNLPITLAERLRKLQNRAARIITRKVYDIRSSDICDILKWDTLQIRRFRHKAIMMYNIQNNKRLLAYGTSLQKKKTQFIILVVIIILSLLLVSHELST